MRSDAIENERRLSTLQAENQFGIKSYSDGTINALVLKTKHFIAGEDLLTFGSSDITTAR
ncbi:MAG: hypothetical protein ACREOZ_03635 [Gloeomargaritales cyanobacterium]